MYGAFAEPSPPLVLTQDLREIAGRTPLALLPFQLLGDNNQERKSKLAVTHIAHSLYQKCFHT